MATKINDKAKPALKESGKRLFNLMEELEVAHGQSIGGTIKAGKTARSLTSKIKKELKVYRNASLAVFEREKKESKGKGKAKSTKKAPAKSKKAKKED